MHNTLISENKLIFFSKKKERNVLKNDYDMHISLILKELVINHYFSTSLFEIEVESVNKLSHFPKKIQYIFIFLRNVIEFSVSFIKNNLDISFKKKQFRIADNILLYLVTKSSKYKYKEEILTSFQTFNIFLFFLTQNYT